MATEVTVSEQQEVAPTMGEVLENETTVAEAEASIAIAEASAEVAQIEADRDITIAEIQAETEKAQQEVSRDAIQATLDQQEDNEWRRNIEARQANLEEQNREMLSILQELRQPPPNQSENPVNPEVMPESQEAPEPPAPKARPHHRLI